MASDPRFDQLKRDVRCGACGKPATAVEQVGTGWHRPCCDDHRPAEPAKLLTVDEYVQALLDRR